MHALLNYRTTALDYVVKTKIDAWLRCMVSLLRVLDIRVPLVQSNVSAKTREANKVSDLLVGRIRQLYAAHGGPLKTRTSLGLPFAGNTCQTVLHGIMTRFGVDGNETAHRAVLLSLLQMSIVDSMGAAIGSVLQCPMRKKMSEMECSVVQSTSFDTKTKQKNKVPTEAFSQTLLKDPVKSATTFPKTSPGEYHKWPKGWKDRSRTAQSKTDEPNAHFPTPDLVELSDLKRRDPYNQLAGLHAPKFPVATMLAASIDEDDTDVLVWNTVDFVAIRCVMFQDIFSIINLDYVLRRVSFWQASLSLVCPTNFSGAWTRTGLGFSVGVVQGSLSRLALPLTVTINGETVPDCHVPVEDMMADEKLVIVTLCSLVLEIPERSTTAHTDVETLPESESSGLLIPPTPTTSSRKLHVFCLVTKEAWPLVSDALIKFMNTLFGEGSNVSFTSNSRNPYQRFKQDGTGTVLPYTTINSRIGPAQSAYDTALKGYTDDQRRTCADGVIFIARGAGLYLKDEFVAMKQSGLYRGVPTIKIRYAAIVTIKTMVAHRNLDAFLTDEAVREAATAIGKLMVVVTHCALGFNGALNITVDPPAHQIARDVSHTSWCNLRGTCSPAAQALGDMILNSTSSNGGGTCYTGQHLVHLRHGCNAALGMRPTVLSALLPGSISRTEDGQTVVFRRLDDSKVAEIADTVLRPFVSHSIQLMCPSSPLGPNGRQCAEPTSFEQAYNSQDVAEADVVSLAFAYTLINTGAIKFAKDALALAFDAACAHLALALSAVLAALGYSCSQVSKYGLVGSETIFNARTSVARDFGLAVGELSEAEVAFVYVNLAIFDSLLKGNFQNGPVSADLRDLIMDKAHGMCHFARWGTFAIPEARINIAQGPKSQLLFQSRLFEMSGHGPAFLRQLGASFLLPRITYSRMGEQMVSAVSHSLKVRESSAHNALALARLVGNVAHAARHYKGVYLFNGAYATPPLVVLGLAQLAVVAAAVLSMITSPCAEFVAGSKYLQLSFTPPAKRGDPEVLVLMDATGSVLYSKGIALYDVFTDRDLLQALGIAPHSPRQVRGEHAKNTFTITPAAWGVHANKAQPLSPLRTTNKSIDFSDAVSIINPLIAQTAVGLGKSVAMHQAVLARSEIDPSGAVSDMLGNMATNFYCDNEEAIVVVHTNHALTDKGVKVNTGTPFSVRRNDWHSAHRSITAKNLETNMSALHERSLFTLHTSLSRELSPRLYISDDYAGSKMGDMLRQHLVYHELCGLLTDLVLNDMFEVCENPKLMSGYINRCRHSFRILRRISDSRICLVPLHLVQVAAPTFSLRAKLKMEAGRTDYMLYTLKDTVLRLVTGIKRVHVPCGTYVQLEEYFEVVGTGRVTITTEVAGIVYTGLVEVGSLVKESLGATSTSSSMLTTNGLSALSTFLGHAVEDALALPTSSLSWVSLDPTDRGGLASVLSRSNAARRPDGFMFPSQPGVLGSADALMNIAYAKSPKALLLHLQIQISNIDNHLYIALAKLKIKNTPEQRIRHHMGSIAEIVFRVLYERRFITQKCDSMKLLRSRGTDDCRVRDAVLMYPSVFRELPQLKSRFKNVDLVLLPSTDASSRKPILQENCELNKACLKMSTAVITGILMSYRKQSITRNDADVGGGVCNDERDIPHDDDADDGGGFGDDNQLGTLSSSPLGPYQADDDCDGRHTESPPSIADVISDGDMQNTALYSTRPRDVIEDISDSEFTKHREMLDRFDLVVRALAERHGPSFQWVYGTIFSHSDMQFLLCHNHFLGNRTIQFARCVTKRPDISEAIGALVPCIELTDTTTTDYFDANFRDLWTMKAIAAVCLRASYGWFLVVNLNIIMYEESYMPSPNVRGACALIKRATQELDTFSSDMWCMTDNPDLSSFDVLLRVWQLGSHIRRCFRKKKTFICSKNSAPALVGVEKPFKRRRHRCGRKTNDSPAVRKRDLSELSPTDGAVEMPDSTKKLTGTFAGITFDENDTRMLDVYKPIVSNRGLSELFSVDGAVESLDSEKIRSGCIAGIPVADNDTPMPGALMLDTGRHLGSTRTIEPPANATDTTLSNHNIHLYNLAGSPLAQSLPILPNEIILIRNAWNSAGDDDERLVSAPAWGGAVFITRSSFRSLADGVWLMDETINFRLKQLQARNDAALAERPITILNTVPATRYLNSFFFTKLVDLDCDGVTMRGYQFPNLKRMAKKQLPSLC